MKNILILGSGNFGQLLEKLLGKQYRTTLMSVRTSTDEELSAAVSSTNVVVLAIPLKGYDAAISRIAPDLHPGATVMDVCSVKLRPQKLLHELLPDHENWLITHPLFGPQSASAGTEGLQFIVCEESGDSAAELVSYFKEVLKLDIIRMSADEHDKQMARAQALTFYISEALSMMDVEEQELMTPSYRKLLDVRNLVNHETQDLLDLFQNENPYADTIRGSFLESTGKVRSKYS
ncbi:MAG: prephenate dehydrogenase/arogenate dehydrogenase family protein [Patescibacteria group bacterium]